MGKQIEMLDEGFSTTRLCYKLIVINRFIDMENYVKCDDKNILEKIKFLEFNIDIAEKIAKNGQELVWTTHSLDARANQLKRCFEKILNGTF